MKNFAISILCVFLLSCSNENKKISIDIDKEFSKEARLKLSDIISSIEYIALETDTNCLVEQNFGVLLFSKEIVVINKRKCLLFDRATGKFIKEILHRGNDPEGYNSTMLGKGLLGNENDEYLFLREWNGNISTYSYQTGERLQIPYEDYGAIAYLDKNKFVTTALNLDGKQRVKMWIYDNYNCVDSISNNQTFELKSNAIAFFYNEEIFYRSGGNTFYKYHVNDTVYQIKENRLIPEYEFISSNSPNLEMREHPERMGELMKECFVVEQIVEDDTYIMYSIAHEGEKYHLIHNKKSEEGGIVKGGIINDIDNGINPWIDHITDKGEYVFVINPSSLDDDDLKKYNIKEDDNPLIAIGYKK